MGGGSLGVIAQGAYQWGKGRLGLLLKGVPIRGGSLGVIAQGAYQWGKGRWGLLLKGVPMGEG